MNKIKHSKFKNTGILFELLVRQITADILTGVNESKANKILHKFFNESIELGKELKLYQLIVNERAKDSVNADRIIETILKARRKLSESKILSQKYELIKEIKDNYPIDQFLNGKISNYTLLASIYKIFENHISSNNYDPSDVILSRNCITENLLNVKLRSNNNDTNPLLENYKKLESDHRILSYKILVDSFNKKYSTLNDKQQTLLKEYINNVSNTNSLKSYINSEISLIKDQLSEFNKKISDKVVNIKLNEVILQLDTIKKGKLAKDSHVTSLLVAYELIKELKNAVK